MRNKLWLTAIILSALFTFLVALLTSIAANYLAPIPVLLERPWLVYGSLAVIFIVSLPINIYLARHTMPEGPGPTEEVPPHPRSVPAPNVDSPLPKPTSHLPGKSYRELVGRDALIGEIVAALRDPAGKWMVTIDGMGGIGKTALAREVSDRCLKEHLFEAMVWEQAPKEQDSSKRRNKRVGTFTYETALDAIARQLGALDVPRLKLPEKESRIQTLLQAQRVLVVLDNLETARERQNDIARKLRTLLNPSKALLTSRHRFQGDVYSVSLTGLEIDDSVTLIRRVAEERNIDRIVMADLQELREIADVTGGSPLALKLIVGQLTHLPVEVVLSQLREIQLPTQGNDEDDYYRFYKDIFFPSWRLLSDVGKKLLISMSHFEPNLGGTLEAMAATSGLADDQLIRTIDELWRLSFLEVGESPNLNQVRYYLHALTQYFVLSDIVKVWE